MRCKTCGYALWNISTRACPECGTAFKPSQFEFVPNSVRFCCPHCRQKYFGTTRTGHLEPRSFDCVSCHRAIDMDEMLLLPDEGVDESSTRPVLNPFVPNPITGGGFWKRWARTVGWALVKPGQLGESLADSDPRWSASIFMIVTTALVGLVSAVGYAAFMAVATNWMMSLAASSGGGGTPPALPGGGLFWIGPAAVGLLIGTVVWVILLVLWALLAHLILRMTGPTHAGWRRTIECVYYSSGAAVLTLVPCLGWYGIGQLWMLVSVCLSIQKGQRVSGGRAALAGIVPPILAVGTVIGLYAILIISVMNSVSTARATAATVGPPVTWSGQQAVSPTEVKDRVQMLSSALRAYREQEGRYPTHASQLCELPGAEALAPIDFLMEPAHAAATTIGGQSIAMLEDLSEAQRQISFGRAAAMISGNSAAHRVGDFVFVYPPATAAIRSPNLWTVCYAPGAGLSHDPSVALVRVVAKLNGEVEGIDYSNWDRAVEEQNALRKELGLAPIPFPEDVTVEQPAASGAPMPGVEPDAPSGTGTP